MSIYGNHVIMHPIFRGVTFVTHIVSFIHILKPILTSVRRTETETRQSSISKIREAKLQVCSTAARTLWNSKKSKRKQKKSSNKSLPLNEDKKPHSSIPPNSPVSAPSARTLVSTCAHSTPAAISWGASRARPVQFWTGFGIWRAGSGTLSLVTRPWRSACLHRRCLMSWKGHCKDSCGTTKPKPCICMLISLGNTRCFGPR